MLAGLMTYEPRAVLDIGCGTGFIARPLAPLVDRVDAVDISAAMIEAGKRLPSGDHPGLAWIVGRAEDVVLHPPYCLVTAGDSLHWMEWAVVLPRLASVLSPAGSLATLNVSGTVVTDDQVLHQTIVDLIRQYTTFNEWRPDFDLVTELERRGLFREQGREQTETAPFHQSVDEYVESFHARASLSWQRMEPDAAAAFDSAHTSLDESHVVLSREGVRLYPIVCGYAWPSELDLMVRVLILPITRGGGSQPASKPTAHTRRR